MKAENIKNVKDIERYLTGVLNDFEKGIVNKDATMDALYEYSIMLLTKGSK